MSAQGGTIAGRAPVQLPIRPIALLLAAVTAAAVGITAIRLTERDARVEPAVSNAQRFWGPTTGHPVLRDRHGLGELSAVPVQRLYPDGFDGVDELSAVPVQRLYPDGFDGVDELSAVPVQRLYPDGFDGPATYTPIFDDVRRKW